jgi:hypothetical protein
MSATPTRTRCSYCTTLRLPRGYLVYAEDGPSDEPQNYAIRNTNCEICVRSVDVRKPPTALLRDVTKLADEIGSATSIGFAA